MPLYPITNPQILSPRNRRHCNQGTGSVLLLNWWEEFILAGCTRRTPGFPHAFAVCQHTERRRGNNGPFYLPDSSTEQNIPPPLTWRWYSTSSFQKNVQAPIQWKKALGLQQSYSVSYAAKHRSLSSVVLLQLLWSSKQLFFQLIFTETLTFLQFGQKAFSSSNTTETDIHCVTLWSEYITSNPVHLTCPYTAFRVHSYGLCASERNQKATASWHLLADTSQNSPHAKILKKVHNLNGHEVQVSINKH